MSTPQITPSLLVVDDEPDLRTLYELTLLREGYRVDTAADLLCARELLAQHTYDAVITDMRLPDGVGLDLVHDIGQQQRREKTIVITAYGSAQNAVDALKAGAFDYLTKPVDLKQFRAAVASALRGSREPAAGGAGDRAPRMPPPPAVAGAQALACIVGDSALMVQVRQRIERVARSMAPVLIQGESGTGKELAARALHSCSHRADGPFIAVNCGAIPDNLLEAEFFGVRKGAYTGATHDRPGYFQAAQGGTLFLDEIGDLPLSMQAKLLRSVQERQIRPLGSAHEEAIDVRFVSATHKDLALAVRNGRFRQDLFYRINVIEIRIPPLRERREDLPTLVQALLHRLCQETGHAQIHPSGAAIDWLLQQPLPGNVRELENLLHRGLALCNGESLELEDLRESLPPFTEPPPPSETDADTETPRTAQGPAKNDPTDDGLLPYLDQRERDLLVQALQSSGNNLDLVARTLGLTPAQLRFRLQRLSIVSPDTPQTPAT